MVAERAAELRQPADSTSGEPPPSKPKRRRRSRKATVASADVGDVIRKEGDYWTIAYEGRLVRLRDAKGLRYLSRLLLHPGREFHVADLVTVVQGADSSPVQPSGESSAAEGGHLGDAGELLDGEARSQYKRRLEELRSELEEASRWSDRERATILQHEIDAIAGELASAYGLGGRSRKGADVVERIRKAVTNRIRDRIAKIEKEHASLGAHLDNSIRMGAFCSYSPEKPTSWSS